MGRREVLNSRNFPMIFLSFQRGTAPNSVSVLMNGHRVQECGFLRSEGKEQCESPRIQCNLEGAVAPA